MKHKIDLNQFFGAFSVHYLGVESYNKKKAEKKWEKSA